MAKSNGHPSGDDRFKAVDLTMKMFKYEKDALVEVLNTAQEAFGFLSEDLLIYISQNLRVPLSQVYGVATFYHLFTFEPLGEHNYVLCTGTACHVKGAPAILEALSAELGIQDGETTEDGFFSLRTARCLGSCGLAPVSILDGRVIGKESPESAIEHLKSLEAERGEAVEA